MQFTGFVSLTVPSVATDPYILTLRTYIYEVYDPENQGQVLGWYPTTPANAAFAWTVLGVPCPPGGCPDGGEGLLPVGPDASHNVVLDAVLPNPTGGLTSVLVTLGASGTVTLTIYDVLGRVVLRKTGGRMDEGRHRLTVDASGLPPGAYVLRTMVGDQSDTTLMLVSRR
jgi:hypothetical protein